MEQKYIESDDGLITMMEKKIKDLNKFEFPVEGV